MSLHSSLRSSQARSLHFIRRARWSQSHSICREQQSGTQFQHPIRSLSAVHRHGTAGNAPLPPTQRPQSLSPSSLRPPTPHRSFASLKATGGKAEADLLVEELQELYEVAKDEFEIATDSTDGATIYAASDRESARDALNQLLAVYDVYTSSGQGQGGAEARPHSVVTEGQAEAEGTGEAPFVETTYDHREISQTVKDEVRKRVGQRVRELKNAVEVLEERAKAD